MEIHPFINAMEDKDLNFAIRAQLEDDEKSIESAVLMKSFKPQKFVVANPEADRAISGFFDVRVHSSIDSGKERTFPSVKGRSLDLLGADPSRSSISGDIHKRASVLFATGHAKRASTLLSLSESKRVSGPIQIQSSFLPLPIPTQHSPPPSHRMGISAQSFDDVDEDLDSSVAEARGLYSLLISDLDILGDMPSASSDEDEPSALKGNEFETFGLKAQDHSLLNLTRGATRSNLNLNGDIAIEKMETTSETKKNKFDNYVAPANSINIRRKGSEDTIASTARPTSSYVPPRQSSLFNNSSTQQIKQDVQNISNRSMASSRSASVEDFQIPSTSSRKQNRVSEIFKAGATTPKVSQNLHEFSNNDAKNIAYRSITSSRSASVENFNPFRTVRRQDNVDEDAIAVSTALRANQTPLNSSIKEAQNIPYRSLTTSRSASVEDFQISSTILKTQENADMAGLTRPKQIPCKASVKKVQNIPSSRSASVEDLLIPTTNLPREENLVKATPKNSAPFKFSNILINSDFSKGMQTVPDAFSQFDEMVDFLDQMLSKSKTTPVLAPKPSQQFSVKNTSLSDLFLEMETGLDKDIQDLEVEGDMQKAINRMSKISMVAMAESNLAGADADIFLERVEKTAAMLETMESRLDSVMLDTIPGLDYSL